LNDTEPEVVSVDGEEFYQWKVVLRVPKNWTPESGVFIAVAPPGGIANFPAAIQGARGFTPTFRNVDLVELAYNDPTPAGATWTLITPGTETSAPVFDLELTVHAGQPGATPDVNLLAADDLEGTATDGYIFQVKSLGGDPETFSVEMVAQKVGNTYWPTTVSTLSDVSGANALAQVTIPTQPWPYRLRVAGQQIVSYDGTDVQVDLVARLGGTGTGTGATDGNVIARGQGLPGSVATMQNLIFSAAYPVASSAGFGEVSDGASRVVYIRAEQIGSGIDTYDTVSGKGLFNVEVQPLP
jgi:hypothetical protein